MDINFLKRNDISFKEKLKNIWGYYKYYILFTVFIIVAIILWISSCSAQKKYDITVVVNVGAELSPTASTSLASELEKICPDFNEDGEVLVEVVDCSFKRSNYADENAIDELQTLDARYFSQFGDKNKILYILSQDALDAINRQSNYETIVDGEMFPISGTGIETALCPDGYRDLGDCYIFCRAVIGSIKGERGVETYHKQACKMLDIIIKEYSQQ